MATMTTEQKLAAQGFTMAEAKEYVYAMVGYGQAQALADKVSAVGLNAQDLAQIAGIAKNEVIDYFNGSGVDAHLLNSDITQFSLVSYRTGEVYLSNPLTGKSKLVADFGTYVSDIATDHNGDIYATDGSQLYRYDFSEGRITTVSPIPSKEMSPQGLSVFGDYLVLSQKSAVWLTLKNGDLVAKFNVPFADATSSATASDSVVIGDKLYRPAAESLTITDVNTGQSTKFQADYVAYSNGTIKTYNFYSTVGMVNSGEGLITVYQDQGQVGQVNLATHQLQVLADVQVPVNELISGASEARQMHVDLWGTPA